MVGPQLIVFVGPVGAGKSTHVRLLCLYLRRRGLKVRMCFLKTNHLFAYILVVFLVSLLVKERSGVYPIRALIEEKPHIFRRIFRLWLLLDLISITIKFLLYVCIPLRLGYVVLVEEYIPAIVFDYVYLSKTVKFPSRKLSFALNYVLRLLNLCRPTQTFFLDSEGSELSLRWKLRGSPSEREDYVRIQRSLLFKLSKTSTNEFFYLNTQGKTIWEIHSVITRHLQLGD